MFDIGWTEMLVIAIVMIVVVGPKDLPRMLRTFGKTTAKLRSMAGDFQKQFNEALKEAELDEVKKSVDTLRGLNPAAEIKKQLNPFEKAAADVRAGLDSAMKPAPSKGAEAVQAAEPAAAAAVPAAEPLKAGATGIPGVAGPEAMPTSKPVFPAMPDPTPVAAAASEPAKAPAKPAKAAKPASKPAEPKAAAKAAQPKPASAKPAAEKKKKSAGTAS
jgi:sec-independent protein translocase protein TatB